MADITCAEVIPLGRCAGAMLSVLKHHKETLRHKQTLAVRLSKTWRLRGGAIRIRVNGEKKGKAEGLSGIKHTWLDRRFASIESTTP